MHTQVVNLQAPGDQMFHLWFEPWGDGLSFPPGTTIKLQAFSLLEGELEIDRTEERIAVYGWPGSTLGVCANGKFFYSFDVAVPNIVTTPFIKETITMLFGPAPVPIPNEGGLPDK